MKLLLLLLALLLPAPVLAARVTGEGFSVEVPEGWQIDRDLMGVPLMARPSQQQDAEGWGSDLLTITREPADRRRTCLEAFTQRKLSQIATLAEKLQTLEQEPLDLPARRGRPATRLTLRYTQGPRELMAYVLVLDAGPYFLTATLTAPPARFEFHRAQFRVLVESLRAASSRSRAT